MEPVLLDAAVKGAVILALTAAAAAALRSASSAVRHLAWSTGMAATVALPGLGALLPRWDAIVMEAPARPAPPRPTGPAGCAPRRRCGGSSPRPPCARASSCYRCS